MADRVTINQLTVIYQQLDPESMAAVLLDFVEALPHTHFGIDLDDEQAEAYRALTALHNKIAQCEDLARQHYDPNASRADRRFEKSDPVEEDQ